MFDMKGKKILLLSALCWSANVYTQEKSGISKDARLYISPPSQSRLPLVMGKLGVDEL